MHNVIFEKGEGEMSIYENRQPYVNIASEDMQARHGLERVRLLQGADWLRDRRESWRTQN